MQEATMNAVEDQRQKVSISTRLIALAAFTIPLIGGALSSFFLFGAFRALQGIQSAGVGAVMAAMKEASLPVIVSLYVAAFFGLVVAVVLVVRMMTQTTKASPPFWFFIVGGVLSFLPAALFWKCQMLILEVLSPGSKIGSAGIGGVGAEIAEWLLISLVAAPIIFVILLVASVVPLPSRPGPKVLSLIAASVVTLTFVAAAVGIPFLIDGPKRKNEMVALPVSTNSSYSDHDNDIEKDASLVLTLTADNKLYYRQARDVNDKVEWTETVVTIEELPAKIKSAMESKTPDKRIAYFKCDINAAFENILPIFQAIRNADVDKVGLVVVGAKTVEDPNQIAPVSFEVRVGEEMQRLITNDPMPISPKNGKASPRVDLREEIINDALSRKPNPLVLVVALEKDGKLLRNNSPTGTIDNTRNLEDELSQVFKEREGNGVFREGTNEIEKKTYIKAAKSTKYGDFIKLVEAVKTSGASPIGIQIDDVN